LRNIPTSIWRPQMLHLGLGFLIDVQSSTEKQNARSNARPPVELRWKAVFVILILRNKQYYRFAPVLIRVRHISFSQEPHTTLIRPWTCVHSDNVSCVHSFHVCVCVHSGNVSRRNLCLQQSAPAFGLTHSCVTMLTDSQGCELSYLRLGTQTDFVPGCRKP